MYEKEDTKCICNPQIYVLLVASIIKIGARGKNILQN